MSIGSFDPDDDENGGKPRIESWRKPKSAIAKKAFAACRREYFHGNSRLSSDEYRRWKIIEEKCGGSTEESYLYKMWVEHRIEETVALNAKTMAISLNNLLFRIEKEDRRNDWVAKNRKRLLESRGSKELANLTASSLESMERE